MDIECKECGSSDVMLRGTRGGMQRFQCNECGEFGSAVQESDSPARIGCLDIETLPGWKRFWRLGEEDWNIDSIVNRPILLGWSFKWLFEPEVFSDILTPAEALHRNDKRITKSIWKLVNQSQILVAHNGDGFDLPWLNTMFLLHGCGLPSPYLTVDTKREAAKRFYFPSNKLEGIARFLGLERKLPTDYSLWVDCEQGVPERLEYMRSYNEQDIHTLEEVYITLRPWIKHPNMSLYTVTEKDEFACAHCGGQNLKWFHGLSAPAHYTPSRVYEVFQCKDCGAWCRKYKTFRSTSGARLFK